jgi:chaperone BCS1
VQFCFLLKYDPDLLYRCILLLEDLDAAFTRSVSRDSTSTGAPTVSTASTKSSKESSDGSTLSLSGLLNSLDGVAAAEGRYVLLISFDGNVPMTSQCSLLFATTNHIERLDPALSRPGRMDVWINFTHATKWQAGGLFKCFFPSKPLEASEVFEGSSADASQRNLPLPKRMGAHVGPLLTEDEISQLAKRFADQVPENELSVRRFSPPSAKTALLTTCVGGRFAGVLTQEQNPAT